MLKFKELLQLFCIITIELPLEILGYLIVPIAWHFVIKIVSVCQSGSDGLKMQTTLITE